MQAKLSIVTAAGGGAVAVEGDQDGVDNHTHLVPWVDLRHCVQMTIPKMNRQKKRGRGWAIMDINHNT